MLGAGLDFLLFGWLCWVCLHFVTDTDTFLNFEVERYFGSWEVLEVRVPAVLFANFWERLPF